MLSSIPPRFFVATVTLVLLASFLLSPPLEIRQPAASAPKTPLAEAIPRPSLRCPEAPLVARSARGKAPLVRAPRIEPVYEPDRVVADALVHTARRGESVTSIAHRYLSQTVFMTAAELESAMRRVNGGVCEKPLVPGEQVAIPGYDTAPVVEQPVPMAKDYEVRAIYLTGAMAGAKHGVYLIRRWKELGGNAIVFDVKDSDGSVSVSFNHDLAPKLRPHIDNLPKFARFLHSLGLHSIARIALFRDELLVKHHPELAVRSRRSQQPWRENGKLVWTDPSRPEVQDYNITLAKLAATSGVDEIQFDYVRFPAEGDQKDAQFFFQAAHPEWQRSKIIAGFLARAYGELRPLGVLVSLDVFGVMAWQRPVDLSHTGQDIVAMVHYCDVLSPMIYPSHFFGMDGYTRPGDAPEHFIGESMERFQEITADTGVVLRPWLQAFGWRTRTYSPQYILRQVATAKEEDGIGYLFWNARNDYSKPFIAMAETRSLPGRPSSPGQLQANRMEKSSPAASGEEPPAPAKNGNESTNPTTPAPTQ
jgi:hypothetical protein